MSVLGVIPARWGSKRFPGKMLANLAGKPVVVRVLERCRQAQVLDELVVATDDARIAQAVSEHGGVAVMTRPDHPSGTDRAAEVARSRGAEVIVNIQGDEPFMDPGLIDRVARVVVESGDWDMATAAVAIRNREVLHDRSVVKVVWGADGRALYFSRSPIPCVRDGDYEAYRDLHWWHVGIYAYRRDFLFRVVGTPQVEMERAEKLEQLRALCIGGRIKVVQAARNWGGIDTPEDLKRAEAAIRGGEVRVAGGAAR